MSKKNSWFILKQKKFFLFFLIFITSFSAFSQELPKPDNDDNKKTFFGLEIPDYLNLFSPEIGHKATVSVRATNYQNFMTYTLGSSCIVEADMKEIKVNSGIDIAYQNMNVSLDAIYAPTLFNIFNPGIRLINHFEWYFDEFFEYDFLFGLYFEHRPIESLTLKSSLLYQIKTADIYSVSNIMGNLVSTGPALEFYTNYEPCDWFNVTVSLSSYTFFKYFLFFSPDLRITAEFRVNPFLYLSITGEAQFVDFLTLSANFNNLTAYISISWRF